MIVTQPGELWYKNAIVYCIDVSAFVDPDGDGLGDFIGLTSKLDYLAGLGVTCMASFSIQARSATHALMLVNPRCAVPV